MIERTPNKVFELVEAGEALRDKHFKSIPDQVRRYHGPWYDGNPEALTTDYDAAPLAYEYISLVLPTIAWDNPSFEVKSKRGLEGAIVDQVFKHALNRWAVDTDLQEALELAATDFLFAFGVLLTEMEPTKDQDPAEKDPKKRPVVNQLDPRRFGADPFATNWRDCRIQFHMWVRDRDDLLEEAKDHPDMGWNVEAIKKLGANVGVEKLGRDKASQSAPPRDEIVGYQCWIPEWDHEDVAKMPAKKRRLFKGTLVDVAASGADGTNRTIEFIRKARPFYGPSWGPYSVLGAYKVPGKLYPLGPLTAIEAHNRELNASKKAYLKSLRARKKIGLASDKDPTLADTVIDTPDGEVALVNMDNLDRNFREVELAGPTEEQRLAIIGLESDADTALGMSDAKKGDVTGIGTATENAIADAAGNQRLSWKKKRFRKGVLQSCKTAAWYIWNGENVEMPLSQEATTEMGLPVGSSFRGGEPGPKQATIATSKTDFEDLEIQIEVMSTERVDEGVAQARSMQLFGLAAQTMPMVGQFPMAGWVEAFDMVGESLNVSDLGKRLGIDRVQAAAMNGQLPAPPGSEPSPQQPRMSGDRAAVGNAQGAQPRVKKGGVSPRCGHRSNRTREPEWLGRPDADVRVQGPGR